MLKIYLILILFSINTFSQMLQLEDRYTQVYKNIEKKEYKEKFVKLISNIFQNNKLITESGKIIENSYENKIMKEKIIIFFINILYDNDNFIKIKKLINEMIKEDDEFKTGIIKIIKSEKDSKIIFKLLKENFYKKMDKRFNVLFLRYLNDKFLCQYNINLAFNVFAKRLLEKDIENIIVENFKKNEINSKYTDKLRQELVSLPYAYSINAWMKETYERINIKIKNYFSKSKSQDYLINRNLKNLELDIIYSLLENDLFLNSYKKEFKNEFLSNKKSFKKLIKLLIVNNSDDIFNKIKEKRFNCFHLDPKMFNIEYGPLLLYVKSVLNRKKFRDDILLILFKSLR